MSAKRFPAICCLALALLFQLSVVAAMSPMGHECCGGRMTGSDGITATPCRDDLGANRHLVTGASECIESGFSITETHGGESSPCSSCTGDCAGAGSPVVLPEATSAPNIPPSFMPLRLDVSLHFSQASRRLERPPRQAQS
jgi:hypothetical protein